MPLAYSSRVLAANNPAQTFTLDGELLQAGTTSALLDASAKITIDIIDPTKTCLLYEETQTVNTSATNGYYAIQVGSNTGDAKRTASDPGLTMAQVYQDSSAVTAANVPGQTCAGSTYTPTAGDARYLRITVTPSSTGVADVLSPDTVMDSVPSAIVAETVQGLAPSNLLQVNTTAPADLSQANLENIFSTTNYPKLQSLIAGTSTQYMVTNPSSSVSFNGQAITNVGTPSAATDAATKGYADSYIAGLGTNISGLGVGTGNGEILTWDAATGKWIAQAPAGDTTKLPLAGGTMTGAINMGGQDITNTGYITMNPDRYIQVSNLTSAQETTLIATPLGAGNAGAMWYNSTDNDMKLWNGSAARALIQNGGQPGAITVGPSDANALTFNTNNTARVTIDSSGNVGVGTTSPYNLLVVDDPSALTAKPTLTSNLLATDSTASVSTTAGMASSGTFRIEGEVVGYSGKTATTLTGLVRGLYGTTAAFHWSTYPISPISMPILNGGNLSSDFQSDGSLEIGGGEAFGANAISMEPHSIATGSAAVAFGVWSQATGLQSTSLGTYSKASGAGAAAIGYFAAATGKAAFAAAANTASGDSSVALGRSTLAPAYAETVVGSYNVSGGETPTSWVATDPLFVVGNGATSGSPSNALTILKDGNVGIGTTTPGTLLDINGAMSYRGMAAPAVSPASQGRIYFDSTANEFMISQNGSSYIPIATTSTSSFSNVSSISNTGGNITLSPAAATGSVAIDSGTASSGSTSGALVVTGGAGVSGDIYSGGSINAGSTMSAVTSLTTPQIYGSNLAAGNIKIDGTSNATPGNVLLSTAGGRVGVGTTSPGAKLAVNGFSAFNKSTAGYAVDVNGDVNLTGSVGALFTSYFNTSQGTMDNVSGFRVNINSGNSNPGALFMVGSGSTNSNTNPTGALFTITTGGNVGIGTTSPSQPLDVAGNVNIANSSTYMIGGSRVLGVVSSTANSLAAGTAALASATTGTKNTAVGTDALQNVTTASHNTGVGFQALRVSAGDNNTAFGDSAGLANTSGTGNVAVGVNALIANTTGASNTAVGMNAGKGVSGTTVTANNVFVGYDSGMGITTGASNTLLGYQSGYDLTTGNYNTLVGEFPTTGVGVTTGSNNILIGKDVRPQSQTGSNQMNIGNLIYASGLGAGATLSTGDVGIGTDTPSSTLDVNGAMTLEGVGAPAVSSSGQGRIYFDSTANEVLLSQNGGAYAPIATTSTSSFTGVTSIANAGGNITLAPQATSGSVLINSGTASTNSTTGALQVTGGVGVSGDVYVGSSVNAGTTMSAATSLTTPQIYGSNAAAGNIMIDGTSNATPGNVLLSSAGGDVGVGTTTPSAKFSVGGASTDKAYFFYDNAQVPATTDGQSLYVYRRAAAGDTYIRLYNYQSNWGSVLDSNRNIYFTSPGSLYFRGLAGVTQDDGNYNLGATWNGAGSNQKFIQYGYVTAAAADKYIQWQVDATGNFNLSRQDTSVADFDVQMPAYFTGGDVGIGTTSPATKLDILGGNGDQLNLDSSTSQWSQVNFSAAGTEEAFVGFDGASNVLSIGPQNSNSTFDSVRIIGSSGSALLTMKNSGNVGIGTTSPTQKLDVNGTVKATDFSGTLNGVRVAAGQFSFVSGSCSTAATPCSIDISSGGFTSAPYCTITMKNPDGSNYTERMVIQSVTSTALNIWKGTYADAGTTMVGNWICVGP